MQIFYIGDYINGVKCGMWETLYRYDRENSMEKICSGLYDEQGLKNGKWVELSDNYNQQLNVQLDLVIVKLFKWDTIKMVNKLRDGILCIEMMMTEALFICFFDLNGSKCGKWIELWDKFRDKSQVIFKGEYKNNKKFGYWQTMFRDSCFKIFENIGGGQYNEDGLKFGKWVELNEDFCLDYQVIQEGEYKLGKKCGCWIEMKREKERKDEGFRKLEFKNQQLCFDQNN
ncbi:unnamed protein product [Paramecium sonneborni]|uniref:Uncharacterized protein n=1 Tax=Paramecium sonneborni TaxID=65129 RepID=A0A8S1RSV5_9CILI|nr:unnamed protein product [Paramecium sonneborni]